MAPTTARLDEAPRPGGLIYREIGINTGKYVAVNAEGQIVEDAPPKPENTEPGLQPHGIVTAAGNAPAIDAHALGVGIAAGLAQASAAANASAQLGGASNTASEPAIEAGVQAGIEAEAAKEATQGSRSSKLPSA